MLLILTLSFPEPSALESVPMSIMVPDSPAASPVEQNYIPANWTPSAITLFIDTAILQWLHLYKKILLVIFSKQLIYCL